MLRSRIAAAAVGASVLGVTAALVPTVSNAADDSVTAATSVVSWQDSADDFTAIDTTSATPEIPAGWSWFGEQAGSTDFATSLDQVASFGDDGVSAKDGAVVLLVRGLQDIVTPDAVPALVTDASANAGGDAEFGLLIAKADAPNVVTDSVYTDGGLQGADTTWSGESNDELAADLAADGDVVFGYSVLLNGATVSVPPATDEPAPTEEPAPAETATPAPTASAAATPTARTAVPEQGIEKLLPETPAASTFASRAAVTPADSGIADLVIDDTTTYFTPQPTATAGLVSGTSAPYSQATTSGIQVQGTGFAPYEVVSTGLAQGERGIEIPRGSSVADQNGNVVIVVVVPTDFAPAPGDFALTLVGQSSAQTATTTLTLTADPAVAPVATPISGRATFTG